MANLCCVLDPIRACGRCDWTICWTCYHKQSRSERVTSILPMHDKVSTHIMNNGRFPEGDIIVYPD